MITITFPTPDAAESAFYNALESADLDAMMAVWEDSNAIVCIHPLGPRLQGTASVRAGWRRVFQSGVQLRFQLGDLHRLHQGDLAVHSVYEHISVLQADEQPTQPVIATNIYRRTAAGWRLVLHHAAPAPPVTDRHARPARVH